MRGASHIRGFLSFAIIIQMIFSPLAHGQDRNAAPKEYTTQLSNLVKLDDAQLVQTELPFTDEEKDAVEAYFNMPARALLDMVILEKVLAEKIRDLEVQKNPTDLAKQIRLRDNDKKIGVTIPGVGTAEFTSLGIEKDSPIVTRFILNRAQKVIISFDTTANEIADVTDAEKSKMSPREYNAEVRKRNLRKFMLQKLVAETRMTTKRPPISSEEINPFPDLSEADPQMQQQLFDEFLKSAKDNIIPKEYMGMKDTSEKGLDTVVIVHDGYKVHSNEEYESFSKLSTMDKVKNYWKSIFQPPRLNWEYWDNEKGIKRLNTFRTGDSYVAQFSMVGQSYIFAATQILQNGTEILRSFTQDGILSGTITSLHSISPVGFALVAGWAVMLGITPTYRNLTMLNQNRQVFLFKSFLNSTIFNYVFSVGLHGVDAVFSMSKEALNNNYVNATNGIVTNLGKTWWVAKPRADENNGKNLYQINYGSLNTQVDKSFMDQQRWYLYSNVFKTADLVFKGSLGTFMYMDFTWSRAALLLSIPIVHYVVMKYTEVKDYKEKIKLRQEWNEAVFLQKPSAYRQKLFGLKRDENSNPLELELTGDNKFLKWRDYKIPIFYLGAVPGLIYDTWVVLKMSGIGAFYISKYTYESMASMARYSTKQMFSYNTEEQNAYYFSGLTCESAFLK